MKKPLNTTSLLLAIATFVTMGFKFIVTKNTSTSGWQTICFDGKTSLWLASLFNALLVLNALLLTFFACAELFYKNNTKHKISELYGKLKSKVNLNKVQIWLIAFHSLLCILGIVCLGIYCNQISVSPNIDVFTIKHSLGWGPFVLLFSSFIATFIYVIYPIVIKYSSPIEQKNLKEENNDQNKEDDNKNIVIK